MEIEKNIPMPKSLRQRTDISKMEVGDSILLENHSKVMAIRLAMKRNGWACTSAAVDGGVRVWRTK